MVLSMYDQVDEGWMVLLGINDQVDEGWLGVLCTDDQVDANICLYCTFVIFR